VSTTATDDRYLPLYEAKMIDFFDHRRAGVVISPTATIRQAQPEYLSDEQHADPNRLPIPRVWITTAEVDQRLRPRTARWLMAFCNVTSPTNERTFIGTVIPRMAVGNSAPVVVVSGAEHAACLDGAWASHVFDYVARQKVGGVNMNFLYVYQFATPSPSSFELDFVVARVLELTFTADDLAGFAADLGYAGPAFRWDSGRRALIRAELDAMMFRLYGIVRDDVDYIMETFPIVRRHDEERFGEYRTKRLILERYDAMAAADAAGVPYETPLDPPPGDPAAAHTCSVHAVGGPLRGCGAAA
jgi:hypothetical protein